MFTFLIKLYLQLIAFIDYLFNGRIKGLVKKNNMQVVEYGILNYIPYRWCIPFIDEEMYYYYYKINGKYYISSNDIKISPLVTSIYGISYDTKTDITFIYNKYSNLFPLWLVIKIENMYEYDEIEITKSDILGDKTAIININSNKDKQLSSLYNLKYIK